MFSTRVPRASFLDSPLRLRSHENRRLATATRPTASPLGHGSRPAADRPAQRGGHATGDRLAARDH